MPLSRFGQTYKTILFEEFKIEGAANLYQLLKFGDVEKADEFTEKLKELEVRSYAEFLEKFKPVIYEMFVPGENGFEVKYTLEKPEFCQYQEVDITEHSFYKSMMDLYVKKGASGVSNNEFNYDDIRRFLTPESEMRAAQQMRRDLEYNYKEYLKLEETGLPSMEKAKYVKNIQSLRKQIVMKYKERPLALIPLALADTEVKLNLLTNGKDNSVQNVSEAPKMIGGSIAYDDQGDIMWIESHDVSIEEQEKEEKQTLALANYIRKDFNQNAPEAMRNSEFMANLVVSNYAEAKVMKVESIEELEAKKSTYQAIYKQSQESLIQAISAVIEKLLAVQVFFEHASTNGKLETPLIIANCKADQLVQPGIKEKLREYLMHLSEHEDKRVWFAILPAIQGNEEEVADMMDISLDDDLDMDLDMSSDTGSKNNGLIHLQTAKALLEVLKEAKVMTFFNFKANESTGFLNLTAEKVREYKTAVKGINSEYAVFTYPNFTLLPKKEGVAQIGVNQWGEAVFLNLPGIYLDSAYVACALTVAYQQPSYLKSKGFKTRDNNPGVRFNLEEETNSKTLLTKLNRETALKWSKEAEQEIIKDRFGFTFCSNKVYFKDELINNIYVFNARTLAKDSGNADVYKPIYKTLTKDFVGLYLNSEGKVTPASIRTFLDTKVKKWKAETNVERYGDIANNILQAEDDIDYIEERKALSIKFGKEDEILQIEVIED